MTPEDARINTFIQNLYNQDQKIRIDAINQLGDIGDELCLKELREQLKYSNEEYRAYIIAIGKLKKKLGIR